MDTICIATTDGRAYYSILTRIRKTGLAFRSLTPEMVDSQCCLVLTTRKEIGRNAGISVAIEDLSENVVVLKGQLVARLGKKGERELIVGIDPGSRIGIAIFYQNVKIGSETFRSKGELLSMLDEVVKKIQYSKLVIKLGSGAPKHSESLARLLRKRMDDALIEIVDEKDTSSRQGEGKLSRDQLAAERIAYRKGLPYLSGE